MAWSFGESWDCYAASTDMTLGYWDAGQNMAALVLIAGRFTGSQAVSMTTASGTPFLLKNSPSNDPIHHITVAVRLTAALTGTTTHSSIRLADGATDQVCIVFRVDGAILLTSATPGGTVLATYTGAITAANTWFGLEFEVIIHPTAGRFRVRKNGNTVDDFDSGAVLNTRPGTNSWANRLTLGIAVAAGAIGHHFDDLLWRSDTASVPWVGDIRCYARMPASDVVAQFAKSPNPALVSQSNIAGANINAKAANAGCMSVFTAFCDGTITTGTVSVATGATGNMKVAIYDSNRALVLATSNAIINPVAGNVTFTLTAPLTVTRGTSYYLAVDQDATISYNTTNSNFSFTTAYASFPANNPSVTGASPGPTFVVTLVPSNAGLVNEAQQDGATTYVYDATPGHADLYTVASIPSTPIATIGVTVRGFMQKSDAGTRLATVQLKSGTATVSPTAAVLNSSSWGWVWRTDLTDPNTGAAWTAVAVNAAQIGPVVVS